MKDPSYTPPQLSLYSFPGERPDPPGMATPPLCPPASIPFKWEKAPGKPRELPASRSTVAPSLDLPPRMLAAEGKTDKAPPAPKTVLAGPVYSSLSFSFGERGKKERVVWFWKRRKVMTEEAISSFMSSSSSSTLHCRQVAGGDDETAGNVTITRLRRNGSLSSLGSSHVWGTIYGGLKQVLTPLPWRRHRKAQVIPS
ncbi:hypothetical protein Cni_G29191 [Canna indica]|uniref:Uncharacterized protein n=1 Tax=Canna indica TaxID=4628 RepID=A0AAQ3QT09_9LILI|nr:hypothetical protein Cni_G29191 [Canna indica]